MKEKRPTYVPGGRGAASRFSTGATTGAAVIARSVREDASTKEMKEKCMVSEKRDAKTLERTACGEEECLVDWEKEEMLGGLRRKKG